MEGGAKFLKKQHTKKLKQYKNKLRSLRQKHVKTNSAKMRKQQQIAQTLKHLKQLRARRTRRLRRRVAPATAVATLSPVDMKVKYASSYIQPIVSAHSSPASNLTVSIPSPVPPLEPSEQFDNISPVASSVGTDVSMLTASPAGALAPAMMNISPITDNHSDQGSLHLSDLGSPASNTSSPATTIATNSM